MKQGLHCYISGRVQGVCFRMEAREQAILHGLTGWVRNLPDGRVEVMAFGEAVPLAQLAEWLKRGPELARVLSVEREDVEYQDHDGFKIRLMS
jgi:acylphosphatase